MKNVIVLGLVALALVACGKKEEVAPAVTVEATPAPAAPAAEAAAPAAAPAPAAVEAVPSSKPENK